VSNEGLLAITKEMRQMRQEDKRRALVECPNCGTPLDYRRGVYNCPMGDFTTTKKTQEQ